MDVLTSSTPEMVIAPPQTVRLDLGCGTKKKEGFTGVDRIGFPGVDVVCNVGADRWPWDDNSVDEAHSSHMLEHLWPWERVHLANELFRVLKPGARATFWTPDLGSDRAYGDLGHVWPPVSASWLFHLNAKWRAESAPHGNVDTPLPFVGVDGKPIVVPAYTCDFDPPTWSFATIPNDPFTTGRNPEWLQMACVRYRNAAGDIIFTLTKPVKKP